jgi:ribosome-binding factor A
MVFREEKAASFIKNLASEFIKERAQKDILMTVSNVSVSPDLKKATILVSIFPEKKQAEEVEIIKKINPGKFREFAKDKIRMKFLPFFEFKIDKGEKKRRRIEELLKES